MSDTTVAAAPPWAVKRRPRPTWGLYEGDELAPGRTVLRRIGGGRRYEAFLCWDEHRLAVLVAKVLRPDMARDETALRDLEREAAFVARLAHPVVVRGFGAELGGRFPQLVLEHLDGPTLDELLTLHGPLALEQILPLGLHMASALHYLANEGVAHLDVKPSNVVMGGPPRLIDFSVARTLDDAAALRSAIGTDAYMAPEQRDPDGRLGPPADIFGLAKTLTAGLPRRAPRELTDLLEAGLDPEPENRPTAREFAEALEPLVAALPQRMTLGRK
jgi:eukaryotic-like serine/threonine-protein kinase